MRIDPLFQTADPSRVIEETLNGKVVDWMGNVSDDEYLSPTASGLRKNERRAQLPHVIVKMYPGRSEHQKTQLAEAIVKDVMAFAKVGDDAVSVAIEEVTPGDWPEKVYKPDIVNSRGKLYKKPRYNPLE